MKRNSRIAVWTMFVAMFTFVAVAIAAPKDTYTFDAKNGNVTFDHKKHSGQAKDCSTCHHGSKANGSDAKNCNQCHKADKGSKDGKEVPSVKDALHKTCKECHQKDTTKKAPGNKCSDCHKK